jgi:hypothetical protein
MCIDDDFKFQYLCPCRGLQDPLKHGSWNPQVSLHLVVRQLGQDLCTGVFKPSDIQVHAHSIFVVDDTFDVHISSNQGNFGNFPMASSVSLFSVRFSGHKLIRGKFAANSECRFFLTVSANILGIAKLTP